MGVITPNGEMFLLNVNIDPTNQLWFDDKTSQETFFKSQSVVGLTPTDYTFIQKDNYVRVHKNADQLYNANYLMYRNTAHSNKWFYAFIKDITWLSDSSSAIKFETDVYQTWSFLLRYGNSLIERETPPTDEIGEHLLDEGLQLSDYTQIGDGMAAQLGGMVICVATTIIDASPNPIPFMYNKELADGMTISGVYSGSAIIVFDNTTAGIKGLNNWLKRITDAGASEAITAIYMCPKAAFDNMEVALEAPIVVDDPTIVARVYKSSYGGKIKDLQMGSRPDNLDGYYPRCNKLLSPPFLELYVHNSNGSSVVYDINEFGGGIPKFEVWGNVNPLPQFKLIPIGYKNAKFMYPEKYNIFANVDEGLSLQNYPMCSYTIDAYKAWLSQNGTSTAVGVVGNIAAAGASVALAAGTGGATIGLSSIMAVSSVTNATQLLAKSAEATLQPPQAQNNASSGSVNATNEANDFFFTYQSIRAEWAEAIDMYLHMYGYKVSRVKRPSFNCRMNWYYVKMVNPIIFAPIPVPDLNKIKELFINGITFWNNHNFIGSYNTSNNPRPGYVQPGV